MRTAHCVGESGASDERKATQDCVRKEVCARENQQEDSDFDAGFKREIT